MKKKELNQQELEAMKQKIINMLNRTVENGASEAEAQTAAKLAQKLMAQYGIDENGIAHCRIADVDEIIDMWVRDKCSEYEIRLGNVIARNFRVRFLTGWCKEKQNVGYMFWGRRSDVQIAAATYTSMLAILWVNAVRQVGDTRGHKTDRFYWDRINSFGYGFVDGLKTALDQNAQKNALVLVMDEECQQYAATHFGNKKARTKGWTSKVDFEQGQFHGRMAFKGGAVED